MNQPGDVRLGESLSQFAFLEQNRLVQALARGGSLCIRCSHTAQNDMKLCITMQRGEVRRGLSARHHIFCRPAMASARMLRLAYSMLLPAGRPRARRVIWTLGYWAALCWM